MTIGFPQDNSAAGTYASLSETETEDRTELGDIAGLQPLSVLEFGPEVLSADDADARHRTAAAIFSGAGSRVNGACFVRARRRNLIEKALIAGCTAFACFGFGLPARVFSRPLISDKGVSACCPFQSKKQKY